MNAGIKDSIFSSINRNFSAIAKLDTSIKVLEQYLTLSLSEIILPQWHFSRYFWPYNVIETNFLLKMIR